MKCQTCQQDVDPGARFCQHCGARLLGQFDPSPEENHPSSPPDEPPKGNTPPEDAARHPAESFRGGRRDEPERDIWSGGYTFLSLIGTWVLAAAVTLLGLVGVVVLAPGSGIVWLAWLGVSAALWALGGLRLVYYRLSIHYRLTSQRLIHEHGLLSRQTERIEVIDVDDVTVHQSFLERLVGVGTLRITSSDRTHPELILRGIQDVRQVATQFDEARRAERIRRSLHIEQI